MMLLGLFLNLEREQHYAKQEFYCVRAQDSESSAKCDAVDELLGNEIFNSPHTTPKTRQLQQTRHFPAYSEVVRI